MNPQHISTTFRESRSLHFLLLYRCLYVFVMCMTRPHSGLLSSPLALCLCRATLVLPSPIRGSRLLQRVTAPLFVCFRAANTPHILTLPDIPKMIKSRFGSLLSIPCCPSN